MAEDSSTIVLSRTSPDDVGVREIYVSLDGENIGVPFVYDDLGGNTCGCGDELGVCQVVSANLQAPEPIP